VTAVITGTIDFPGRASLPPLAEENLENLFLGWYKCECCGADGLCGDVVEASEPVDAAAEGREEEDTQLSTPKDIGSRGKSPLFFISLLVCMLSGSHE
jgi:hypothetical protein